MYQVKLFKSIESNVEQLEAEINAWLSGHDVKIVNIFGNIAPQTTRTAAAHESGSHGRLGAGTVGRTFAPSDVLIAVLYEKG